jgi:alpha-beta hydrolase superfamily lysophospholipase
MRGFGYSGGARGCSTLHQLLLDVGSLLHQVNTGLPLFLYGHCLGALTCLLFSLLNPHLKLAGIICTSPLLAFPSDGRFTWLRLNFLKNAGKVLEVLRRHQSLGLGDQQSHQPNSPDQTDTVHERNHWGQVSDSIPRTQHGFQFDPGSGLHESKCLIVSRTHTTDPRQGGHGC